VALIKLLFELPIGDERPCAVNPRFRADRQCDNTQTLVDFMIAAYLFPPALAKRVVAGSSMSSHRESPLDADESPVASYAGADCLDDLLPLRGREHSAPIVRILRCAANVADVVDGEAAAGQGKLLNHQ
jgi:hypothetical protein